MFQFDIEMLIESKLKKNFRHQKLKTDKIKTEMIFFASETERYFCIVQSLSQLD